MDLEKASPQELGEAVVLSQIVQLDQELRDGINDAESIIEEAVVRRRRDSIKLGALRWHWTRNPDNPDRMTQTAYAKLVTARQQNVSQYARAFEAWMGKFEDQYALVRNDLEGGARELDTDALDEFQVALATAKHNPAPRTSRDAYRSAGQNQREVPEADTSPADDDDPPLEGVPVQSSRRSARETELDQFLGDASSALYYLQERWENLSTAEVTMSDEALRAIDTRLNQVKPTTWVGAMKKLVKEIRRSRA